MPCRAVCQHISSLPLRMLWSLFLLLCACLSWQWLCLHCCTKDKVAMTKWATTNDCLKQTNILRSIYICMYVCICKIYIRYIFTALCLNNHFVVSFVFRFDLCCCCCSQDDYAKIRSSLSNSVIKRVNARRFVITQAHTHVHIYSPHFSMSLFEPKRILHVSLD